ncbi:SDR family NAD(P)-dependent oxidoreductase [Herbiconiux ginsengi]|uniref:SDR family NAD(P)-dependent oxidoreductase n=1 Tax=Herbiconiux ginsengi TaxID=381665 RepID=UPI0015875F7C|nr:SDR family oxidoreductase [Herbiconiux ginsengi]
MITGATGGIGAAICWRLHADGYGIIAQYGVSHDRARMLGERIRSGGGFFEAIPCDLSSPDGPAIVTQAVQTLLEANGAPALRALVNNAAKLLGPGFGDATVDQFDDYMAVNVRAPFFLSQGLAPLMPPGGSIVNISSASAHFSSPGDIVYAMTKSALESLTRNMAEAIARAGLRVNAVVPGFTDNGHRAFQDPAAYDYMSSFSVLGGVADPDVVAEAVSFLISDRARRTTGTILDVTGGSTLAARNRRASSVRALIPDS